MVKVMLEAEVEEMCLDMLGELGYVKVFGPDISEDSDHPERNYGEVVLVNRLRNALRRINKAIPEEAIEEAVKKVLRYESQSLVENRECSRLGRRQDFFMFFTDLAARSKNMPRTLS